MIERFKGIFFLWKKIGGKKMMIIKLTRNCEYGDAGEIVEIKKELAEEVIGRRLGRLIEVKEEIKKEKKSK